MKKKKILISALLMLIGVGMAQAQTAYVSVQQNGVAVDAVGTATFDVSSQEATMEFDANGNAVMSYNGQIVAKLTKSEVEDNGGELVGALAGTEKKVSKTITTDFATLYSPFQLKLPEVSYVSVYAPTLEGNTLKMTESRKLTGIIPPCTGIILYGEANSKIEFSYSAETATTINDDALSGTSVAIANPTKDGAVAGKLVYTLAHEGGAAGFYQYKGATLGAGKAYLYTSQVSEAKGITISFNDDDVTGITPYEIQRKNFNGKFIENGHVVILKNGIKYNLNGQEVK